MSVIPLSHKEAIENIDAPEGARAYGAGTVEQPDKSSGDAMDKTISAALVNYREVDPEPDKRGLDGILSDNIERYQTAQADEADFNEALPSLEILGQRYKDQGDIVQTVRQAITIVKSAQADPRDAGMSLMESYARLGPWSATDKPAEKPPEAYIDHTGTRHSGKVLDHIISTAQKRAETDTAALAELQKELKALLPGKTFTQAVKLILDFDSSARRDPMGACAQFAAAFNMPWTPRQQAEEAHRDQMLNVVNAATPHLPGLAQPAIQGKVVEILQRPDFVRTNDPGADLARAYEIAAIVDHQHDKLGRWAESEIAKMPPDLARMVEHTLLHDPTYKARAAQNVASRPFGDTVAPQINLGLAVGIAQEKMARLAKAKKAGRASTSTGTAPRGSNSDSGIDAAISRAMKDW